MLLRVVVVGLGGFIGANLRYGLSLWLSAHTFSWPTFIANMIGCFGLAFFATLINNKFEISESVRLFISTGFFGALTTFSTLNMEALSLFNQGKSGSALFYLAVSIGLGLMMGAGGIFVAQRL